jgi:hypothetical protein
MKMKTSYNLMMVSILLRLFWITVIEPHGAARAIARQPAGTLSGTVVRTLPFVIYPSIVILIPIVIGALLKKRWAYTIAIVFGAIHFILTLPLAIMGWNTGLGEFVVLPACLGMIVFSWLTLKHTQAKSVT